MTGKRTARRTRLRRRKPIFWTERALSDLDSIAHFISTENPAAAQEWTAKLFAVAGKIAAMPLGGRRVPGFSRDDLRELLVRSYRIVHRVTPARCEILTVFQGHRLFPGDVASDVDE